ncbi:unnamed protein product [Medioppia subpectinata]|uniref:Oxidized purine nucleoside triphosphate hydrolase n=1 Tax=Medioppia subpectinata TaxID=1979941 RepID=A0A7R9PZN3_9ACAR|nr:unnamed protein product [Medioppia subpectinata]CAG2107273.1 unnamed protein product [Medioppia subpectinata]
MALEALFSPILTDSVGLEALEVLEVLEVWEVWEGLEGAFGNYGRQQFGSFRKSSRKSIQRKWLLRAQYLRRSRRVSRKRIRVDTLVLVTNQSKQILLGLKKRGFGQNKWNGFGGKVEVNETIEEAAKRELLEESNLECNSLTKMGILSMEYMSDPTAPKHLEIHVFHTEDVSGEPKESEEMRPKWFAIEDIPFKDMWADDPLWLPDLLKGSRFRGFFRYSDQSTIIPKYTLVLVTNKSKQILLGLKKRGFGQNKWNGFGGKVEANETVEEAAKRELKEESNLECNCLNKIGVLSFEFVSDPTAPKHMETHVFQTDDVWGEVQESDEMKPKWFGSEEIPFEDMWADDHIWFPLMLKGSHFRGYFRFSDQSTIIAYTLQEVAKHSKLEAIQY